jgi:hypothetical protein
VAAFVLAAAPVLQAQAPSPSPSPSSPRSARPIHVRPAVSPKPVAVDPYNRTPVQVISVDTTAATMTFRDIEAETQTWQFDPPELAKDPLLKPGAKVIIIWKSDANGQPITKILGVGAVSRPAGAASTMPDGTPPPKRAPAPSSPSPSPSPR